MGEVFEGFDVQAQRRVAVKRLRVQHAAGDDLARRFEREILATAQLSSRHVVSVHDAGVDADGEPFMVMDFLDGEDLASVAARLGVLPVEVAVRLVAQTCEGLIAAHAVGIVHRDIKPSNLFLVAPTSAGERIVKILDFGIARLQREDADRGGLTELTQTGAMIGSPQYMSPEQLRGARGLDHRADVWSLGIVLYRLLCGVVPHPLDSMADLLIATCSARAPSLMERAPWVPAGLAAVVHRALEIDVDARTPSIRALADGLAPWLGGGTSITDAQLVPRQVPARPSGRELPDASMLGMAGTALGVGGFVPGRPSHPHSMVGAAAVARPSRAGPVATPATTLAPPPRTPATAAPAAVVPVRPVFVLGLLVAVAITLYGLQRARTRRTAAEAAAAAEPSGVEVRSPRRAWVPTEVLADLPAELATSAAARWFAGARAHCNPVELEGVLADTARPGGPDGAAFAAACAALAGNLAVARAQVMAVDADNRGYASQVMFAVAHPLADRRNGDPAIAAIMRLVLEFWPENIIALYHLGIAEFMAQDPRAAEHLRTFRERHPARDGFGAAADLLLREIAQPTRDCRRTLITDPEGNVLRPAGC